MLVDPLPGLGIPISAGDTLMLANEVCETAGGRVVSIFCGHRNQPIYATLYATAAEKVSPVVGAEPRAADSAARRARGGRLELPAPARRGAVADDAGAAARGHHAGGVGADAGAGRGALYHTSPFELRPSAAAPPAGPGYSLRVAGHADVFYPLRDWCFLAILCSAHANLIWPDDPPAVFCSGDHQTAALAI